MEKNAEKNVVFYQNTFSGRGVKNCSGLLNESGKTGFYSPYRSFGVHLCVA